MAWKIEKWMSDVFPGRERIYEAYRHLGGRELAVVTSAVLDVALVELITLRLAGSDREIESFLGLNNDARAPVGTFGARIQMAHLLGLITLEDAQILRALKAIRNAFAHRVNINFMHAEVHGRVLALNRPILERTNRLIDKGIIPNEGNPYRELERDLFTYSDACEGLLLAVLTIYQAYFHKIHGNVERLGDGYSGSRQVAL